MCRGDIRRRQRRHPHTKRHRWAEPKLATAVWIVIHPAMNTRMVPEAMGTAVFVETRTNSTTTTRQIVDGAALVASKEMTIVLRCKAVLGRWRASFFLLYGSMLIQCANSSWGGRLLLLYFSLESREGGWIPNHNNNNNKMNWRERRQNNSSNSSASGTFDKRQRSVLVVGPMTRTRRHVRILVKETYWTECISALGVIIWTSFLYLLRRHSSVLPTGLVGLCAWCLGWLLDPLSNSPTSVLQQP